MAAKKTTKGTGRGPARRRALRQAQPGSTGLEPRGCIVDAGSHEVQALVERVEREGGSIVGCYRDPYGGHPLVLAVLPIGRVEPTPFQRDLSEAHHKRLADVIEKTGRFLDPVIAVTAPQDGFWTPNGRHRLEAMRRVGARAITALVVPDREVAWQILALNTEKAHNLKERSLEVIRICRDLLLSDDGRRAESSFASYLEDPAYVTIGVCYERKPRFAGGAYHPVLRRTERFVDLLIGDIPLLFGEGYQLFDFLLMLLTKKCTEVVFRGHFLGVCKNSNNFRNGYIIAILCSFMLCKTTFSWSPDTLKNRETISVQNAAVSFVCARGPHGSPTFTTSPLQCTVALTRRARRICKPNLRSPVFFLLVKARWSAPFPLSPASQTLPGKQRRSSSKSSALPSRSKRPASARPTIRALVIHRSGFFIPDGLTGEK